MPTRETDSKVTAGASVGEKVADAAQTTVKSVETAVSSLADQGRQVQENVAEVAGNLRGAVDASLRKQPMATLALAAAVGFVLGALWKA